PSIRRVRQSAICRDSASRLDHSVVGDREPRTADLSLRGRPGRGPRTPRQSQRVRSPGRPDGIGGRDSLAAGGGCRRTSRHHGRPLMAKTCGVAGRLAAAFIHSRLTLLFILASLVLGALAIVALPREEEPQIIVPMVDVFAEMPGATPADVEQRVTRPIEQMLWEVSGVEYVYSTSSPGQSMVVVRFKVNEPQEAALVRLNQKLAANADRLPPGGIGPIGKRRALAATRNWRRMRTASRPAPSGRSSSRARSTMCRSLPSRCGRGVTRTINCDRSLFNSEMPSLKSTTCRR